MPEVRREVSQGLTNAGMILLACGWLGLVFAGMGILFRPSDHSPALGWTLLAIAAVLLIVTMDRWVKAFPGLLVLATLNSLLMLYTGHSLNDRSVQVPRQQSAVFTLCMAASAFLTTRLLTNRLNPIDRVALFGFVLAILYQAVDPRLQALAGPVALALLLSAWVYDRLRYHHAADAGTPPR
jgi:hypothetical protein